VTRGTVSEINLSALHHNLIIVRQIAGKRTVIAVVKADAYGHGAVRISRELVSAGVSHLAVAYTEEAKILRKPASPQRSLYCLTGTKLPIILSMTWSR